MNDQHRGSSVELQLDWDADLLLGDWLSTPDNYFFMLRLATVAVDATSTHGPDRVLEIAAASAQHSCELSLQGMRSVVVEPSTAMLGKARERMAERGARVELVRGVAETLPFPDETFDRVLLDSAIDHLAQPAVSVREMTRVLKRDGRLVITFVNYGGFSVRFSRLLYEIGRRLGRVGLENHLFWDTPVPAEHTFECTLPTLTKICAPYVELDRATGVSLGWGVPGWGALLRKMAPRRALGLMDRLDRFARHRPNAADFIVSVWRRRADAAVAAPAASPLQAPRTVASDDPVYPSRARAEADFWGRTHFGRGLIFRQLRSTEQQANRIFTGDPQKSWIEDLRERGPFRSAAVLGCDEAGYERWWLEHRGSEELDVYELSASVIRQVRAGLGGERSRARFVRCDLNFAALPEARYDVVWSSGCLHHIANLEHLFEQVERALRPGGLFAFRDYVGERRMQFDAARLRAINERLQEIPPQYRRTDAVKPPRLEELSPFCGVRSNEIVELAEKRFEWVHRGEGGVLFPLNLAVDIEALERDLPEVAQRLYEVDGEVAAQTEFRPCAIYAVLRRKP